MTPTYIFFGLPGLRGRFSGVSNRAESGAPRATSGSCWVRSLVQRVPLYRAGMAKGMFTAGCVVLLKAPVTAIELERALPGHDIVRRFDKNEPGWLGTKPGVLVAMRPEVNGYALVDCVEARWPDHMGDPKNESELMGAWALGHFGPLTYPNNLARAAQQDHHHQNAQAMADAHVAFARVRTSYVFGGKKDQPVFPEDYDPLAEMHFVTGIAAALLGLDAALGYFNPGGEVLKGRQDVLESLKFHAEHDLPPFELWSNIRLAKVEALAPWLLMDTVGMGQVDVDDQEALVPPEGVNLAAVDRFMRNASLYLLEHGPVIETNHTMDGPGGVWRAQRLDDGLWVPPRPTLRWTPTWLDAPAVTLH